MKAAGGQPDNRIADLRAFASDDALAFDYANDEPCNVVLSVGVETGHLCRLSPDQRAAILATGIGDAGNHFLGYLGIKVAAGEIVEKKKRGCALHCDVVHAVIHEVRADRMVQIHLKGNFELRSHAVCARDQHRVVIFLAEREKPAKAAYVA